MSLVYESNVFSNVSRQDANRIMDKIDWLWGNREYVNHVPLGHNLTGFFKLKVGDYRVLYEYDKITDEMKICIIGPRDTIYRDASKKYK